MPRMILYRDSIPTLATGKTDNITLKKEVLAELEAEITAKVKELKTAENKVEIITVLDSLITERNKKAKLLK